MDDSLQSQGRSELQSSDVFLPSANSREKFRSIKVPLEQKLDNTVSTSSSQAESASQAASQSLWSTGILSSPIPSGFYSVVPDRKLKELFDNIPSPDELHSLGMEGLKADMIMVDMEKDKKLSMLKQLSAGLVKGLNSNPASQIKKLSSLVADFYKRPNPQMSPARCSAEEISHLIENHGIQLLGQIRHGSCRPRAILFKVLADSVGLESKLVVGLSTEENLECNESCKHMSVIVELNSVEFLVDLMRFPGQLVPFSAKAIFTSHISAAGESDSADYDSCDSPLEPNSPLRSVQERAECQSQYQDESSRFLFTQRADGSNAVGPSLRNIMLRSSSLQESTSSCCVNVANTFWGWSRRRGFTGQHRTASPSPEHPLFRTKGRSLLGSHRQSFVEYNDGLAASRSDGASTITSRRARRRSTSITPEIGDDIVRAVRAMSERMKQNRLLKDQNDASCAVQSNNENSANSLKEELLSDMKIGGLPSETAALFNSTRRQISAQKAMSLPSSPHQFTSRESGINSSPDFMRTDDLSSAWDTILQSSPFIKKPLLPFEEWHIDFSELSVGTRVGIGFFGEVFRGIWNGTDVAIKVFLEQDLTTENMADFCNEISILSRLRHPNVILFLGACMKPPHLSLVTEYMEMGSLYYLIHTSGQKSKLNWRRRLKMLRDICRGLMCMHRMKIIHRDLKSANCLVNKHWTVKICDFGLSRALTVSAMSDASSAGTPEWMAPELIRNEPFTEKCDIFSLGVIMWELCTLSRPWEGIPSVQVVYSVANEGARLEIPDGPLGSLIADCWREPDRRPSCQEILTRLLDCEYTLC